MVLPLLEAARAATWSVDPTGAGDFLTLAAGVEGAANGDTLLVEPGVYTDRLTIDRSLVLRATQGPSVTTIRDGLAGSFFLVLVEAGHVVFEGFELTTSNNPQHCIRVRDGASVDLRDLWIHGCDAGDGLGGGLRTDVGSTAVVRDCLFEDNLAHWTLGAKAPHIYARGDGLEVYDSVFRNGRSEGMAGAISLMSGDNTIVGNTFEGNVAVKEAGALEVDGRPTEFADGTSTLGVQRLVLTDNTFVGNSTSERGGAVVLREVEEHEVARNVVCGNRATLNGGAFQIVPGSPNGRFHHNVVARNESGAEGGAFFVLGGTLNLEHEDLLGNQAALGGAVVIHDGSLVLRHSLLGWNAPNAAFVDPESTLDSDWNAWWQNTPSDLQGSGSIGAHAVTTDPRLTAFAAGGACSGDDYARLPDSPLLDAGDPAEPDPDGSAPDLGARGEPGSTTGGTTPDTGSTDDTGPPPDDTGALATDTDPSADTDAPPSDGGCGCDHRAGASPLAALGLLAGWRRRRRPV